MSDFGTVPVFATNFAGGHFFLRLVEGRAEPKTDLFFLGFSGSTNG